MSEKQFAAYLRKRMRLKGLTISETAKRAHISRGALNKYLNCEVKDGKISTFVMLARALEEHPMNLFRIFFHGWKFDELTPERTESTLSKDDIAFIADINYPDNCPVSREAIIEKSWELKNTGAVPWVNRRLICIDENLAVSSDKDNLHDSRFTGLIPLTREIDVPLTNPSEHVILTVKLQAPKYPGTMISHWKMVDENGEFSYPNSLGIFCKVSVISF